MIIESADLKPLQEQGLSCQDQEESDDVNCDIVSERGNQFSQVIPIQKPLVMQLKSSENRQTSKFDNAVEVEQRGEMGFTFGGKDSDGPKDPN